MSYKACSLRSLLICLKGIIIVVGEGNSIVIDDYLLCVLIIIY